MADMKEFFDHIGDEGRKLVGKVSDAVEKAKPVVEETAKKAVDGAKGAYEKAKPVVEETAKKAVDGAKELYEKAKPTVEKAVDSAKDAYARVTEKKPADPLSKEACDRAAEEQMEQIRKAATVSDPIRDFYEKKREEDPDPEIPESTEK